MVWYKKRARVTSTSPRGFQRQRMRHERKASPKQPPTL
nr:MAG TPA: hypothetical protein [Caudoviricetes sp.]